MGRTELIIDYWPRITDRLYDEEIAFSGQRIGLGWSYSYRPDSLEQLKIELSFRIYNWKVDAKMPVTSDAESITFLDFAVSDSYSLNYLFNLGYEFEKLSIYCSYHSNFVNFTRNRALRIFTQQTGFGLSYEILKIPTSYSLALGTEISAEDTRFIINKKVSDDPVGWFRQTYGAVSLQLNF